MTRPVNAPLNGVTPKPAQEAEVGVNLHLPFVTPYKDAWEVLRDDEITVKQLVAMRKTDGQARALYRLITLPIRAALKTATFVPATVAEGGEDEAAFVEQLLTLPSSAGGMMTPFHRVVAQILMAIFDGFSAFEMVYWTPKKGPLKGKITLKKIAHRPPDTLTFILDNDGEFRGLRQRTMFQGREIDVFIEAENVVRYAANEEERPFYGESYFQSAYYHWDKKFKLYVIAHLACQRAAVGTRVGKLPANPSQQEKAKFQQSLADLGVAQWMTIPDTYTVESLKEAPNFDFLSYINHHNSQMSKSVLAAFFDKEQGGGDSGKLVDFGQQSDALFLLMLQTIMAEVEEVINQQVIPKFIDWNFGKNASYPKFQFGSLSQEQKGAILDLFKQIAVAGQSLTVRPEFLHETTKVVAEDFGLEIDWETIEEEMLDEKEQQDIQKQMQLDMQMAQMQQQMAGGDPTADPTANPAAGGAPAGPKMPDIDASVVPEGFTLLTGDPEAGGDGANDEARIALTELARDLLDEAYAEVELARGPLKGPRKVRTAAGAKYYGVPMGGTIFWDQEQATAKEGVKGGPAGGGVRGKPLADAQHGGGPGAPGQQGQVHGGGLGAQPQNPGKVQGDPLGGVKPKKFYGNPKVPGAVLLDFGDGTVALRDANGRVSPRQRFDIEKFIKRGWQPTTEKADPADKPQTAAKAAGAGDKPVKTETATARRRRDTQT